MASAPTIGAIKTKYQGYEFRSQVEAQWAVFFDAAGISWQWEPNTYELRPGLWYRPDFWLPDQEIFWEVKGAPPTDDESTKAHLLSALTGKPVLIAFGAVGSSVCSHRTIGKCACTRYSAGVYLYDGDQRDDGFMWQACDKCGRLAVEHGQDIPDRVCGRSAGLWSRPDRGHLHVPVRRAPNFLCRAYHTAQTYKFWDPNEPQKVVRPPYVPPVANSLRDRMRGGSVTVDTSGLKQFADSVAINPKWIDGIKVKPPAVPVADRPMLCCEYCGKDFRQRIDGANRFCSRACNTRYNRLGVVRVWLHRIESDGHALYADAIGRAYVKSEYRRLGPYDQAFLDNNNDIVFRVLKEREVAA